MFLNEVIQTRVKLCQIEVPVNVFRFVFIVCDDDFPQEQFLITTPSVNDQSPCETFYLKQVKLNILLKWLQGSNLSQTFSLFWNRIIDGHG